MADDEVLGRVDTDGHALSAPVDETGTSLAVVPTGAPWLGWTVDPAEAPWDVAVGGETLTVSAVAGDTAVDAFDRTVASGWGTATSGQAWSTSGGSASDYSVGSGTGVHSVGTLSVNRFTLRAAGTEADTSLAVSVSTPVLATGTQGHQAYLIARHLDANNYYGARVEFGTDQSVRLTLIKVVAGAPGAYPAVDTGLTHEAGVPVRFRFDVQGTTLRARAWLASDVEPTTWQATQTDSSLSAAGQSGLRTRILTGNTNTLPVPFSFTDFHVAQLVTVTRSANGISKSHAAGAAVALATTPIIAL
ncbi:hypothetical protein BJP40_09570 [Streptomyces sp. CC53]|nr:hypothetical protein BJP40_09570 [Streptomyces sp. CC53]